MSQQIIGESDLPALFCAADHSAQRSQRMHTALTAANLGLLSMGTLIDVLAGRLVSQQARGICVAVFFLLAFVVTLCLRR